MAVRSAVAIREGSSRNEQQLIIQFSLPHCGYEDVSFLKVLFRRTYGVSMGDYRRRTAP